MPVAAGMLSKLGQMPEAYHTSYYALSLSLSPPCFSLPSSFFSLSLFREHNNNANVSSETESKEEFGCSCTDRNKAELELRSKIVSKLCSPDSCNLDQCQQYIMHFKCFFSCFHTA